MPYAQIGFIIRDRSLKCSMTFKFKFLGGKSSRRTGSLSLYHIFKWSWKIKDNTCNNLSLKICKNARKNSLVYFIQPTLGNSQYPCDMGEEFRMASQVIS